MKRSYKYFIGLLALLFVALSFSGCTPTKVWLNSNYLGGKVPVSTVLEDVNSYISKDKFSRGNKEKLKFVKSEETPLLGKVYVNDAGVMMFFDADSNRVNAINLMYVNTDKNSVEAAKILTVQLCEMIAPIDYVLSFGNQKKTLDHLQLDGTSSQLYEMAHNNNTRVEKLAENEMGLPLTFIRFSKKDGDGLEEYGKKIFLNLLKGNVLNELEGNTIANSNVNSNKSSSTLPVNKPTVPRKDAPLGVYDLSLNTLALGDSQLTVVSSIGEPNSKRYVDGLTRWKYNDVEVVFDGDTVSALVSQNSNAVSSRGIREGSSLGDMEAAYGRNHLCSSYENLSLYEYQIKTNDGRNCYLRFAVRKSDQIVDYISIRYVD